MSNAYTVISNIDPGFKPCDPFLDITQEPGKTYAGFSTTLTILYALMIMILYNFRGCLSNKEMRKVSVSQWDRILSTFYAVLAIFYDLELVYGDRLSDMTARTGPELYVIIVWITVNSISVLCLSMAFLTRVRFRAFLYVPHAFHLQAMLSIFCIMASQPKFGYDIMVPVVMIFVQGVLTLKVPGIFQIDYVRFEQESARKDSVSIITLARKQEVTAVDTTQKLEVQESEGLLNKHE